MMDQYNKPQYNYSTPKGKIITSMIMGIVSVSIWWYPFIFSIPCIVFGIVALSLAGSCIDYPPKFAGMLKAARITGILGLIFSSIYTILWIFLIGSLV